MSDFLYSRRLPYGLPFPLYIESYPLLPHRLPPLIASSSGGQAPSSKTPIEALRFFDLETTGLSGGTGTVAFLAAIGRADAGGLLIRQFFLADYPGESDFIAAVLAELGDGTTIVSYNGRAFDMPLLRTRCIMNGFDMPDFAHLDLLHLSRRLWRRIYGGASLGLLEEHMLGRDRGPDIPGSCIPSAWFDFLKKGDLPEMGLVMSHNAEDIIGLSLVLLRILDVFSAPEHYVDREDIDRRGLGMSLLALGREAEGELMLEAAARGGDEAAGVLLSRRLGRKGRPDDRARVLALLGNTVAVEIERAKHYEHEVGDLSLALTCVDRAFALDPDRQALAELNVRRARLLRKIEKRHPRRE